MKIVIFGLTITSSWGNGHATLWRGLCRGLVRLGHTVTFYEHDVPYYAAHRDMTEMPGVSVRLYSAWEDTVAEAQAEVREADVAMVTSYCVDALAATSLVLQEACGLRCFYDLDAPVTLDRLRANLPVAYIGPAGLRGFDLTLSYTGGGTLRELQERLGAGRVAPLYGSVDPDVHRPVAWSGKCHALSYLGTYAEDRQAGVEQLFIQPARLLPEQTFLLGGAQYPQNFPWTPNTYFEWHVPPAEHARFFACSRMTLNVTRRAMAEAGYCPPGRLFEAAACGTPLLSDTWEGLDEFFTPGTEILLAHSTAEAIAALSISDAERDRIAVAARERTLACHTAEQRAREMVQYCEQAMRPEETPLRHTSLAEMGESR